MFIFKGKSIENDGCFFVSFVDFDPRVDERVDFNISFIVFVSDNEFKEIIEFILADEEIKIIDEIRKEEIISGLLI